MRYETLPAAVWEIVAPHFSQSIDGRQRERMAQAARIDAKAPVGKAVEFAGDAANKQAAASARLRQTVDAFARPPLQLLEELHAQRGAIRSNHSAR